MLAGVLAALLFAAVVQVEGNTTCPWPEQVAEHLNGLLPSSEGAAGSDEAAAQRARLSDDRGELVVELLGPSGEVLGTRRFPPSEACEDLAAAVAVSVAVLISDVHPTYTSPRLAPDARPQAELRAAAPAPPPPAPPEVHSAWAAGLALGLGGSVDAPAAAGDLIVNAWWRPAPLHTAVRLELEGQSVRSVTLHDGRGEWRRFVLGLGIERGITSPPAGATAGWLRGFAAAHLAMLDLRGAGFPVNHASHVLDAGLGAGARAVAPRDGWQSWIEVALSLWPVGHDAVTSPETNDGKRLPVFEAFLRVGAGWGARR